MTLVSGTNLGPYEVTSPLGAGGMGEVYRARDPRLGRDVAVKVLPEEFFEDEERRLRFEREARTLASLNHPGIAAIHSFEEIPGVSSASSRHILVMELVEGEGLDRKIASGPLPLEESLSYARQIAEALEAAHEKGIVHRDLKPANVMVSDEGRVKLLDFGLAKMFEGDGRPGSSPGVTHSPTLTARATAAGVILGTAAYMSPEQARGKPLDKRTDVWAFGCVLFEMLAGKRAFEGETVTDVLAAVLMKDPDWAALPEPTPAAVRKILRRCLQRDARLRLHDIADARLDLEELSTAASSSSFAQLPFEENLQTAVPGPTAASAERASRERGSKKNLSVLLPWAIAAACAAAAGALALRARAPQTPVVRSTLVLPPGVRFRGDNGSVALSPDGRRLAFVAAAGGARPRLWVRSTDSLASQAIDGTEGAAEPFWSPDGQHVGFFADHKVKRVPASGGTVQTLCAAADPRGGTWGERDVIVFAPEPFGGLRRVPASGGTPAELTTTTDNVTSDRMPVFLPGGARVLFFHGTEIAGPGNGIFAVELESKKVTRVSSDNSRPLFAGDALFFVRGRNLMAQRLDPASLRLSGESVRLAEHVWFNPNRWTPNASVSSSGIAVVEMEDAASKGQLTWLDLDGRVLGKVGEPGLIQAVAVSPDGRRALSVLPDDKGVSTLWMVDLERGVASRFSSGTGGFDPCWSPDGRQVAYADENGNLYVKATDGLSPARLVLKYDTSNQRPTSFTADGGTVILAKQSATGWDVFEVALAGQATLKPLIANAANENNGRVSPDGRWLSWISEETGRGETYVMPYPSGEKRQVSSSGADDVFWLGRDGDLAWTRDGRLFASRIGADGPGPPRPLLGGPVLANAQAIAAAPDGKRLLAALPADGGSSGSLTLIANWPAELSRK